MSTASRTNRRSVPIPPNSAPRLRLAAASGDGPVRCEATEAVTLVGSRRDCHLPLADSEVSKIHCAIVQTGRGYYVRDLCSRTGTFLNEQLTQGAPLKSGDSLRVGPITVGLEFAGFSDAPAAAEDAPPVVLTWGEQRFELRSPASVIGRRQSCDVFIDMADVSLAHALLFLLDGVPAVFDLGSRSGTFVNGERTLVSYLCDGDVLSIGGEELKVSWSGQPAVVEAPRATAPDVVERPAAPLPAVTPGELGDLERTIASLHTYIATSRSRIDERTAELDERETELRNLERDLEERGREIEASVARLQERDREMERAERSARERLDRLREREKASEAAGAALAAEKEECRKATASVAAERESLEAARVELRGAQEELARREAELQAQRGAHEQAAAEVQQRAAQLDARQAELATLESAMGEREKAISDRERAIDERERLGSEAAARIESFKEALREAATALGSGAAGDDAAAKRPSSEHARSKAPREPVGKQPANAGARQPAGAADGQSANHGDKQPAHPGDRQSANHGDRQPANPSERQPANGHGQKRTPMSTGRRGGGRAGEGDGASGDALPAPVVAQPLFAGAFDPADLPPELRDRYRVLRRTSKAAADALVAKHLESLAAAQAEAGPSRGNGLPN